MEQVVRRASVFRSEAEWRTLVELQERSGLTIKDFCRREGIGKSTLTRWRSICAKHVVGESQVAPLQRMSGQKKVPGDAPVSAAGRFVDLGVLGAHSSGVPAAMELTLDFGSGISLHLVRR